ncbi:ABC transporter ATP-binding protein [Limnoglobus roseus]|uniref:ABC transporter ATP-binding protein n=1 Tax=Limnoglobus roseus TaxID=2598579 RepID=A0A5C1A5E4_9BACT|nr:ABC transporter ATP-binding protein [Limnoglobus roseus]QEL13246.1 ABC transporter ATP-binding protein [Limnoglobus roseus]
MSYTADMTAAVFENVHKDYVTRPILRTKIAAVRGVSLSVPTGSVFALLGPNRAGKTTLVKMLLSLAKPTGGTINRLGQPIATRATLGRVGYMHENHAFPRYLSAAEVLHFYGGLSGVRSEDLPAKVNALLDRVGLADRRRDSISGFSKGMVQRLGLAQAILNNPDLLILDEPTEGLDLTGRKLLREVVRETKAAGKTVLLVSHVLPEVEELCDDAAVIVAGKLAFAGKLSELSKGRNLEAALQDVYETGAAR